MDAELNDRLASIDQSLLNLSTVASVFALEKAMHLKYGVLLKQTVDEYFFHANAVQAALDSAAELQKTMPESDSQEETSSKTSELTATKEAWEAQHPLIVAFYKKSNGLCD
ncbi:hypothetical protein [Cupriavidus sp. D384]|uniref:hypothetical protein n=1 Tax=Cupriavidus sp. D384 TaxID=1538095 RepID=UPI000835F447|nr:hypothetical protein [Cupriavidus sp. D384]